MIYRHSWWNGGFNELVPDAPSYARKAEARMLLRGQYNSGLGYDDYLTDQGGVK
jgi:hypothetical protein